MEVAVSDFDRTGGVTKTEWPWKLLYNNEGPGDKWYVPNCNSGWVQFDLKKPLLIRGYALKSAGDEPNRDPKNFSLYALNVMDKSEEGDYVEIHNAQD